MREPRKYDNPLEYTTALAKAVTRLEEALLQLLMDPGNPHSSAKRAREILDRAD